MQKTNVLTVGIVFFLAGCHTPSKTEAWRKVVDVRKQIGDSGDRSSAYAAGVHAALQKARIEHKVVTFEYQWTSRFNGDHSTERTVIIYRDPETPHSPWWLADEPLRTPLWLPNVSAERQVAFYVRRPATVIESREFGGSFKQVKKLDPPPRKPATSRIQPVAKTAPKFVPKPAGKRSIASSQPVEKKAPETSIEKLAPVAEPPAKTKLLWRANPAAVPAPKPELIDEPNPAPSSFDLEDPKPLPEKPSTGAGAAVPARKSFPDFLRRILSALTGIGSPPRA